MLNKQTLNNGSFQATRALALVHKNVVLPIVLSQYTGPYLKLDADLASILQWTTSKVKQPKQRNFQNPKIQNFKGWEKKRLQ